MNKRPSHFYRIISSAIIFTFLSTTIIPPQFSYAQIAPIPVNLPAVGTLVNPTTAFNPALIRGVMVNPANPLEFTFSIDRGDSNLSEDDFREESSKLVKYFLASLTVPQKDLWVNLSPYEQNRIIGDTLSHTEMGIDLLAQDYMLKQLTASMIHPDSELGKTFWKRVRAITQDKFGTSEVPTDTFHKIWIVPQEAEIFEQGYSAHVVRSHLKVMLEEDYLALSAHHGEADAAKTSQKDLSSQIMREVLLPEIEREVNEGEIFANLRQIYNSMILAVWYKRNLQDSLLSQVYADQNKIKGIDISNPQAKDEIYNQYVEAFKTGVYDFIREEYDASKQQIVPKKYFSGGYDPTEADYASIAADPITLAQMSTWNTSAVTVSLNEVSPQADAAMIADEFLNFVQEKDLKKFIPEDTSFDPQTVLLNLLIQFYQSKDLRILLERTARSLKGRVTTLENSPNESYFQLTADKRVELFKKNAQQNWEWVMTSLEDVIQMIETIEIDVFDAAMISEGQVGATTIYMINPRAAYDLNYEINPFMNLGDQPDLKLAFKQHDDYVELLRSLGANVIEVDQNANVPDEVFSANAGLVIDTANGRYLVPARFSNAERQGEYVDNIRHFQARDYKIAEVLNEDEYWEGEGDMLFFNGRMYGGYNLYSNPAWRRSTKEGQEKIAESLGFADQFVALELADPKERFYHLDTAFFPVDGETLAYYPGSFTEEGQRFIEEQSGAKNIIRISEADAERFAANAITVLGKNVVMNDGMSDELVAEFAKYGFTVHQTPMSEFLKAGGSTKCCVLKVPALVDRSINLSRFENRTELTTLGQQSYRQLLTHLSTISEQYQTETGNDVTLELNETTKTITMLITPKDQGQRLLFTFAFDPQTLMPKSITRKRIGRYGPASSAAVEHADTLFDHTQWKTYIGTENKKREIENKLNPYPIFGVRFDSELNLSIVALENDLEDVMLAFKTDKDPYPSINTDINWLEDLWAYQDGIRFGAYDQRTLIDAEPVIAQADAALLGQSAKSMILEVIYEQYKIGKVLNVYDIEGIILQQHRKRISITASGHFLRLVDLGLIIQTKNAVNKYDQEFSLTDQAKTLSEDQFHKIIEILDRHKSIGRKNDFLRAVKTDLEADFPELTANINLPEEKDGGAEKQEDAAMIYKDKNSRDKARVALRTLIDSINNLLTNPDISKSENTIHVFLGITALEKGYAQFVLQKSQFIPSDLRSKFTIIMQNGDLTLKHSGNKNNRSTHWNQLLESLTLVLANLNNAYPEDLKDSDAAMVSQNTNVGYIYSIESAKSISAEQVDSTIETALGSTNGVSPISESTLSALRRFIETEIQDSTIVTNLLAELDFDAQTIHEEIFGVITPKSFETIYSKANQSSIFQALQKAGYISLKGTITEEFSALEGSEYLKLPKKFDDKRVQIYNILKKRRDINLFQIQNDTNPVLAVTVEKNDSRKYEAFQISRIKLTEQQRHIYFARGVLESLSRLTNKKLLHSLLFIESVRLLALEKILQNTPQISEEEALAQTNAFIERLEYVLVKKRLKVAFQSKTVRHLNPDVNRLTLGLSLKIDEIASRYGIVFDDRHTTLTTKVKQFIKRAVRTDIAKSRPAIEELSQLIQTNKSRLASWGIEPHEMEILESLTDTGIYGNSAQTSFPAQEVVAVSYIRLFRNDLLQTAKENLLTRITTLNSDLTHDELFDAINSSVDQVVMTPSALARYALTTEKGKEFLRSKAAGDSLETINAELQTIKELSPENEKRFIHDEQFAQTIAPQVLTQFSDNENLERDVAVAPQSNRLMIHQTLIDQVQNELRTYFYDQLLHNVQVDNRNVLLNENTSRDGHQSNIGTNLTGEQQRSILYNSLRYGNLHRVETWGGAVPQVALLKDRRNGNPPEDPFYNLRQSTHILREYLIEVMNSFGLGKITDQTRKKLLARYEFSIDRKILEGAELDRILEETKLTDDEKAKVKNAYEIRQEMLLRGQYIVGLQPYPATVLQKFIETAYKNGMDIFRIFDAFNDTRNIKRAIEYIHKLNKEHGATAKIQPVIHYTTDFPTGIEGYVKLALDLIEASGDALDSLTIKDAGGLLEADEAYKLVKALRIAFKNNGLPDIKIQLHTHDTRGNRQLTLLEAIRANGTEAPIVVDVASGNMAAPFAQPNIRQFTNIVRGTSWDTNNISNINETALDENEQLIRSYLRKLPILAITSSQRRGVTRGRLPGGMKSNFDPEIIKNIVIGLASIIEQNFKIKTTKDKLTLTEDGKRFMDSVYELIFDEMIRITEDVGGISLVTPSSDWIGKQAIQNVFGWIANSSGPLVHFDKSSWTISQNAELTAKTRAEQYAKAPLWAGLPNYLIERAQDKEILGQLYPNINRGVVALAFQRSSGLTDEEIEQYLDENGFIDSKALAKYEPLRKALDDQELGLTKPFVDTAVFKLFALMESAAKTGDIEAEMALKKSEFPRPLIIRMANQAEGLNIPLTLKEMQQEVARLKNIGGKYDELTNTDEDLLLLALFPNEKQFIHLLEERQNYRAKYLKIKKDSTVKQTHAKTLERMSANAFFTTKTETTDAATLSEPRVLTATDADLETWENDIADRLLWLSTRMINEANLGKESAIGEKSPVKVGGHQAAAASSLHIMMALEFFAMNGADHVAHKPHAGPVYHAMQYLLGKLDRDALYRLRENPIDLDRDILSDGILGNFDEESTARYTRVMERLFETLPESAKSDFDRLGLHSYPGMADPDKVTIPTGSVGLGPAATITLAIANKYLRDHDVDIPKSHFYAVIGDAEFEEGNLQEALPLASQYQVDNVTHVIDYNRQSLDGNTESTDKLDILINTYKAKGWNVIELKWGRQLIDLFTNSNSAGEKLQKFMDELSLEDYQELIALSPTDLRAELYKRLKDRFGKPWTTIKSQLDRKFKADLELKEAFTGLAGHDLVSLTAALAEAKASDKPTVIVAHTIKGFGLNSLIGLPGNHSAALSQNDINELANRLGIDQETDPFPTFAEDSQAMSVLSEIKNTLEAEEQKVDVKKQALISQFNDEFDADALPEFLLKQQGIMVESGELSTQAYLGNIMAKFEALLKNFKNSPESLTDEERALVPIAKRLVTISPDVATSTGLGQRPTYTANNPEGTHLRMGIAEMNAMTEAISLGKSLEFFGEKLFPVMTVYDMFLFRRALDPFFYGQYWNSRFIAIGTPSGAALSPEGAQHQSITSGPIGLALPNTITWEPAFGLELDFIMSDSLIRIAQENDEGRNGVYIRGTTFPSKKPDLMKRLQARPDNQGLSKDEILSKHKKDVLEGGYRLVDLSNEADYKPGENVVTLVATGTAMVYEVLAASDALKEEGIYANVIVISSPDLIKGNLAELNNFTKLKELIPTTESKMAPIVTVADAPPSYLSGIGDILGVTGTVRNLGLKKNGTSARDPRRIFRHHGISRVEIASNALELLNRALSDDGPFADYERALKETGDQATLSVTQSPDDLYSYLQNFYTAERSLSIRTNYHDNGHSIVSFATSYKNNTGLYARIIVEYDRDETVISVKKERISSLTVATQEVLHTETIYDAQTQKSEDNPQAIVGIRLSPELKFMYVITRDEKYDQIANDHAKQARDPQSIDSNTLLTALLPESNVQAQEILGDSASLADPVGGIDLNSDHLNLKIKRDPNGIPLPLPQQPVMNLNIEGFVPVIINVAPLSVPAMLGLLNEGQPTNIGYNSNDVDELSYLSRDPMDLTTTNK